MLDLFLTCIDIISSDDFLVFHFTNKVITLSLREFVRNQIKLWSHNYLSALKPCICFLL